jgi:transcriptional regulator with XRE-family HTH domain
MLRKLRAQAGLSTDQVAKEVGISKSALSRLENGLVSAMPPVVRSLLELYGVDSADIEPLMQVARDARKRGWWLSYSDVLPEWFDLYVGLEAEASEIKTYEPQLIPGILQTELYAAAVIRAEHPDAPDDEIDRRVELRMKRQKLDNRADLWVVLDESVLCRPVGGNDIMRAQLSRLVDESRVPGVNIQVLPFRVGEHGSMGSSFSLLSFPEAVDRPIAYLENRAGSVYVEGDRVREYVALFAHMTAAASGQRESTAMIKQAVSGLERS